MKQLLILLGFCLFACFHYSDLPSCICLVSGPTQYSKIQHLEGLASSLGSHARMCIPVFWTHWKCCAYRFPDPGRPALLAFPACLRLGLFAQLCKYAQRGCTCRAEPPACFRSQEMDLTLHRVSLFRRSTENRSMTHPITLYHPDLNFHMPTQQSMYSFSP